MLQNLTGWHALIVLAVIVLLFGAAKLPALARSVGQSMRILKTEVATTDRADGTGTGTGTGDDVGRGGTSASVADRDAAQPRTAPFNATVRDTTVRDTTVLDSPVLDSPVSSAVVTTTALNTTTPDTTAVPIAQGPSAR